MELKEISEAFERGEIRRAEALRRMEQAGLTRSEAEELIMASSGGDVIIVDADADGESE